MSKQKLYNTVQAAKYLGIDEAMVRYYVTDTDYLKPDTMQGARRQFTRKTLDAFRRQHMVDGLTIQEAADYLGMTKAGVRYHMFVSKALVPDGRRGQRPVFSRQTLDEFRQARPAKPEAR